MKIKNKIDKFHIFVDLFRGPVLWILVLVLHALIFMAMINGTDFTYEIDFVKVLGVNEKQYCDLDVDNETIHTKSRKQGTFYKKYDNEIKDYIMFNCTSQNYLTRLTIFNKNVPIRYFESKSSNIMSYRLEKKYLEIDVISDKNKCTIDYDGVKKMYNVDNNINIEHEFMDKFSIVCDDNADTIHINVYDENDLIYYESYDNINTAQYDKHYITKDYYSTLYLYDDYNIDNLCVFTIDNVQTNILFTSKTKRKDSFFESKVGKVVAFNCQYPINQTLLFVDDRKWNDEVLTLEFNNTNTININLNDAINNYKAKEKIIEKEKVEEVRLKIPQLLELEKNVSFCSMVNYSQYNNMFSNWLRIRKS